MRAWLALGVLVALCWMSTTICYGQRAESYDALVQQGKTQLQAGNNDGALASANAAIKLDVNRWEAYAVAGGALMNLERDEEAADQFGHAIDHAPEAKQSGLRDLRKQCLLAEAGAALSSSPTAHSPSDSGNPSGPAYAETVKWIREHIGEAGFPAATTADDRFGNVNRYDDIVYSARFDGCTVTLVVTQGWHITSDNRGTSEAGHTTETNTHMDMTFNLPLDKMRSATEEEVPLQDWEKAVMSPTYVNRPLPTVAIHFSDPIFGNTSYNWSTDDVTYTEKNNSHVNRPIAYGEFTIPGTYINKYGYPQQNQAVVIHYARPGTGDNPQHMAKALNHLIDLCRQNPNIAPRIVSNARSFSARDRLRVLTRGGRHDNRASGNQ